MLATVESKVGAGMAAVLRKRRRQFFIVGGGPAGTWAADALARLNQERGEACDITLFEASALGGGREDFASVSHCQMWLHSGALFPTQPEVVCDLAAAARYYAELCPTAISHPLAVMLESPTAPLPLAECLAALGVRCEPIANRIVEACYGLKLPPCRAFRTSDGTLDLRTFAWRMSRRLAQRDVRVVPGCVQRLDRRGDSIAALRLASGETWKVQPNDLVLLACSSQVSRLLGEVGITPAGLTTVSSTLVAVEMPPLPLLAVAFGGPTAVPHRFPTPLTVFGDSRRQPITAEEERGPLDVDPHAVELIREESEHWFGMPWGRVLKAWRGRKVEYLPPGKTRCQSFHFERPLANCHWILPGKMSLAPIAAERWALSLLRESGEPNLARSVWETPAATTSTTPAC